MIIYLYIKTHKKTNLKFLGKTTQDPYTYLGSGVAWKKHLKEYGKEHTTEILQECNTKDELNYWGRYYSNLWNVAESSEWANRIPETGGGDNHPPERKELFRQQQLGRKKPPRTLEHRTKLSNATKGISRPRSEEHQHTLTTSIKANWETNDLRREKTAIVGRANKGRKHTPEALEKKRQAMLRYWEQRRAQVV
jgi:hypothetical protein